MCSQVQIPHANHPPRQTVIVILVPRRSRRPTRRSRIRAATAWVHSMKQRWNCSGSSREKTSPKVSPGAKPLLLALPQPVVPASNPSFPPHPPTRRSRLQPVIPASNPSFPPPTRRSRLQPVVPASNPSFPPPTRHSRHQPVVPASNPSFPPPTRRSRHPSFPPPTRRSRHQPVVPVQFPRRRESRNSKHARLMPRRSHAPWKSFQTSENRKTTDRLKQPSASAPRPRLPRGRVAVLRLGQTQVAP